MDPWPHLPRATDDAAGFLGAWGRRAWTVLAVVGCFTAAVDGVWQFATNERITVGLVVDGAFVLVLAGWAVWRLGAGAWPRGTKSD
jgi:hypothetical protein